MNRHFHKNNDDSRKDTAHETEKWLNI